MLDSPGDTAKSFKEPHCGPLIHRLAATANPYAREPWAALGRPGPHWAALGLPPGIALGGPNRYPTIGSRTLPRIWTDAALHGLISQLRNSRLLVTTQALEFTR